MELSSGPFMGSRRRLIASAPATRSDLDQQLARVQLALCGRLGKARTLARKRTRNRSVNHRIAHHAILFSGRYSARRTGRMTDARTGSQCASCCTSGTLFRATGNGDCLGLATNCVRLVQADV